MPLILRNHVSNSDNDSNICSSYSNGSKVGPLMNGHCNDIGQTKQQQQQQQHVQTRQFSSSPLFTGFNTTTNGSTISLSRSQRRISSSWKSCISRTGVVHRKIIYTVLVLVVMAVIVLLSGWIVSSSNNNVPKHSSSELSSGNKNMKDPKLFSMKSTSNDSFLRTNSHETTSSLDLSFSAGQGEIVTIESVRKEFALRYGGINDASEIYARGIQKFGSVEDTAKRILIKAAMDERDEIDQKRVFVMSFAGYSVTVGRGNFLNQSFPFVVERILRPLLHDTLGLDILVRNSAIGGIPSFPYGFCFEHFLGIDSDVISWDYSMNENGKDSSILESYIRQSQNQLRETKPMILALNANQQRCDLLRQYTSSGLLNDAICVSMAKEAGGDYQKRILTLPDNERPIGFRHWDDFGAPPNCPGRGSWHPKKMEHELIGWMIAMYFVDAVEIAIQIQKNDPSWKTKYQFKKGFTSPIVQFPPPFTTLHSENPQSVTSMLYGHSTNSAGSANWIMHKVSCRTNFLPATDSEKVLPSIIVSGLSPNVSTQDIIEHRSDTAYDAGWVLDVSEVERDTKIKVEKCGGLGYIDMKIALYGIPSSGSLHLWLPYEPLPNSKTLTVEKDGSDASLYFETLIICEANEKRSTKACQLDSDIRYTVGGIVVASDMVHMVSGAAEYLKRKTCAYIRIPFGAQVTKLRDVTSLTQATEKNGSSVLMQRLLAQRMKATNEFSSEHIGLVVEIQVKTDRPITRKDGACCLSHVVWEQISN